MFFKKKQEIIHKDYCSRCKTTEDLMKYTKQTSLTTGIITQYYMCRSCNADRHKKWYYDGNQKKAMKLNENWRKNK